MLASLSQSGLRILANNTRQQAVFHPGLEQTQVVFYEAGSLILADGTTITVEQPEILLINQDAKSNDTLTIADPLRSQENFVLHLPGRYEGSSNEVNRRKNTTSIHVNLPQDVYAVKSVTVAVQFVD